MVEIGHIVGNFKVTEIRFNTNKQFSGLGVCLSCKFERALIIAEVYEKDDEDGGWFYEYSWRCWCPKCDRNYREGEDIRIEGGTEKIATFLYGRGEYMKDQKRQRKSTVTTRCWVCDGQLADGTSVWANDYFGLHKSCAPPSVASEVSRSSHSS